MFFLKIEQSALAFKLNELVEFFRKPSPWASRRLLDQLFKKSQGGLVKRERLNLVGQDCPFSSLASIPMAFIIISSM